MVAASFLAKACSSSSTGKESAKFLPPCKVTTAFWTLLLRVRRWYGLTAGAAAGRAAGAAAGRAAGAAAGGAAGVAAGGAAGAAAGGAAGAAAPGGSVDLKRIVASSCWWLSSTNRRFDVCRYL